MKIIILLLLLPLVCGAALPQGDFIGSRVTRFERAFYDFRLTKEDLTKAPGWDSEAEFPPLSPKKAQVIAFAQLQKLIPELIEWMSIDTITLERIDDKYWIYLVTFQYNTPFASTGPPRLLTIPVYMDGSTITPLIQKE